MKANILKTPTSGEIALGLVLVRGLANQGATYSEMCLAAGTQSIRGTLNRTAARLGVKLIVVQGKLGDQVFSI
jgi:hypothetical protein